MDNTIQINLIYYNNSSVISPWHFLPIFQMSNIEVPRSFRLQDELEIGEKGKDVPVTISYGLDDGNENNYVTLSNWTGTVMGTCGAFAGRVTSLHIVCGSEYPKKAPTVRFITRVNLPFVDQNGNIIVNQFPLFKSWNPKTTILDILKDIEARMNERGVPQQPPEDETY